MTSALDTKSIKNSKQDSDKGLIEKPEYVFKGGLHRQGQERSKSTNTARILVDTSRTSRDKSSKGVQRECRNEKSDKREFKGIKKAASRKVI